MAQSSKSPELRYRLNSGTTLTLVQRIHQRTTQDFDGTKDHYESAVEKTLHVSVLERTTTGTYELSVTEEASTPEPFDPGEDTNVTDNTTSSVTIGLSPDGRVLSVAIPHFSLESSDERVENGDETEDLQQAIIRTSEAYYREQYEDLFHLFDGREHAVSTSWQRDIRLNDPFQLNIRATFSLISATDSLIHISVHGRVQSKEELIIGYDEEVYRFLNVDALVTGFYELDRRTCWPLRSEIVGSIISDLEEPSPFLEESRIPIIMTYTKQLSGTTRP